MAHAPHLPKAPKRFRNWPWAIVGALLGLAFVSIPEDLQASLGPNLLWGAIAAFVAWIALYLVWTQRAVRKFNALTFAANDAYARSEFSRARESFESIERDHRWPRHVRRIATLNAAWSAKRSSEPWRAIELLAKLDLERWPGAKSAFWSRVAGELAQAHALAGELEAAEAWIAEVDQRWNRDDSAERANAGTDDARSIIACRREDHAGAVRIVDEARTLLEYHTPIVGLRLTGAVRGLALSRLGDPESSALLERQLETLLPAAPGELDFLGAHWPEMRAFLLQHGLVERPEPASAGL
jgi:hypothetical protein